MNTFEHSVDYTDRILKKILKCTHMRRGMWINCEVQKMLNTSKIPSEAAYLKNLNWIDMIMMRQWCFNKIYSGSKHVLTNKRKQGCILKEGLFNSC